MLGVQVMRLGEPRAGDDAAVTAIGFSPLGNLVGMGHANGDVAFWELKRSGWELAKTVKGALGFPCSVSLQTASGIVKLIEEAS